MDMELRKIERFTVVGIRVTETMDNLDHRMQQALETLKQRMGEINNIQKPHVTYGVSPPNYKGNNGPLDFYVCFEVDPLENLPHGMVHLTIEPQLYASTIYNGPLNEKVKAYDFTTSWLSQSSYDYSDAAYYFEIYDEHTQIHDLNDSKNQIIVYSPVKKVD